MHCHVHMECGVSVQVTSQVLNVSHVNGMSYFLGVTNDQYTFSVHTCFLVIQTFPIGLTTFRVRGKSLMLRTLCFKVDLANY